MASKHLSRASKKIVGSNSAWWYEIRVGIEVFIQHHSLNEGYKETKRYVIPWRQIRAALGRKDCDAKSS